MDEKSANRVLLGTAPVREAEVLRGKLKERGVDLTLLFNDQTCNSGCGFTVEMWAFSADIPEIRALVTEERSRDLSGLSFDEELISSVYDPEKPEAICPACGTNFSTKLTECPECGLSF